MQDTENRLIAALRDVSHTVRSLYEGKGSQKRVLIILKETGPVTQRELTKRLGIRPGSVSEVMGKLESAGLILRVSNWKDRRTADISLTEAGERQAEKAMEQRRRRHMEMFSCLSELEKAQLLSLLEKLSGDWECRYQTLER